MFLHIVRYEFSSDVNIYCIEKLIIYLNIEIKFCGEFIMKTLKFYFSHSIYIYIFAYKLEK